MPTKASRDQSLTNEPSPSSNQFWKNVRAITQAYWYPTEAEGRAFSDVIRAWGMLALLILLIIALVGVTAFNSFVSRYLVDVIIKDKDFSKFTNTLLVYGAALVCVTLLVGFSKFLRKEKVWLDIIQLFISEVSIVINSCSEMMFTDGSFRAFSSLLPASSPNTR